MIKASFDYSSDPFELVGLFENEPNVFFLDSSLAGPPNGRYSFIGFDPFKVMEGATPSSFAQFKEEFRSLSMPASSVGTFHSGAVGFLSYDLGAVSHGIISSKPAGALPLFHFGFYDVVITIDHHERKLHVTSTHAVEKMRAARADRQAQEISRRVKDFLKQRSSGPSVPAVGIDESLTFKSHCTREQYIAMVGRALEHIRQGNIYEINLSHEVAARTNIRPSPLAVYRRLRALSPSHFSAFYDTGAHQILSSSPERFLNLKGRVAQIRPMKGTRPRGTNPDEDHRQRTELLQSEKEIAELLMVTDLERNDLGRVCEFGSVRVKDMRSIEEYNTVFQATSTIEGTLRQGLDGVDLIESCFPGGSVTGCPKISAMRIIDELEGRRRGIYTGAFGYLDFSGNLDFNILIRTLVVSRNDISFHVGGGIVADSDPRMEYDETWIKARALMACLGEPLRSGS